MATISTVMRAQPGTGVPVLYSVTDAATILRVSPRTIQRWVRDGRLSSVRLGARVMITTDALTEIAREGVK